MVHISCTWQNNDSSSSPTVITCNCSKAIYWGRGGTRGISAMKIIREEGGVLGAPGDLLAKESTGESWSPHSFHTQSGERTAAPPWLQGRTDGRDIRGVWVKERGGRATPQESENRAWWHTAPRAIPRAAERQRCAQGNVQKPGLCRCPQKPGGHCSLIIN